MSLTILCRRIQPVWLPTSCLLAALSVAVGHGEQAAAPVWDPAAARHLLSRTSFGAAPEEAERLAAMPLEKAVASLLDDADRAAPPAPPGWVRSTWINTGRRSPEMSPEEYRIVSRRQDARNADELGNLRAWWLQQMVSAPTPLREEMTLFWHSHFTSATAKVPDFSQAFYQQNQTWRQHALGNFRRFLEAVTLDPCMMAYLDMEGSDKDRPNENYARELLELFTLGVGNYTENDIRAVARSLTGWDLTAPSGLANGKRPTAPDRSPFPALTRDGMMPRFEPARHDDQPRTLFGRTGRFTLPEVLDIIVAHPACGQHVAGRLIDYFGAADPAGELRMRMAKAFVESRYEIKPMLRVLFTSAEFYADATRANRVKSPVRLLVGACRDLKLDVSATPALAQWTVPLGQELFNPPTVKGWPTGASWINASTLMMRYRLGEFLLEGKEPASAEPLGRPRLLALSRDKLDAAATTARLLQMDVQRKQWRTSSGIRVSLDAARLFPRGVPEDASQLVEALLARMVVTPVRPSTRNALVEACVNTPRGERTALVARLILASPEYQIY